MLFLQNMVLRSLMKSQKFNIQFSEMMIFIYDGSDQAEGYFKSMNEISWVLSKKWCYKYYLFKLIVP